jgi:hypothetical protein
MDRHDAHATSRRRTRVGLFLALAVVASGIFVQQAVAYRTSMHGGITTCATCHLDGHTRWTPVNEVCNTCHPGYAVPSASTMCWTCHAPGQDMSTTRNDASCTSACHLVDGTTSTHVAHADRPATCTTCHPLTASLTDPAGSPHHTRPVPPVPTIAGFLPSSSAIGDLVTLTGTGFTGAYAVRFSGAPARTFNVISDTRITARVPAGATSGPIAVVTPGGTGTSTTSLSIVTVVTAKVTLAVSDPSIALGSKVRLTGAVTPASLAGGTVRLSVKSRTNGEWTTARSAGVRTTAAGVYAWAYRASRRGRYLLQASIARTAAHSAARSPWVACTVR